LNERRFIQIAHEGAVGVLTLDRAEKANAYHAAMLTELEQAIDALENHAAVRVIVVTAYGSSFCGGADLNELRGRAGETAFDLQSARVFNRLARSPRVCLAAINGPAVAGGLELALACDLRVACPEAYFALPEVGLGIIPAAGGTRRLPRLIGATRAKAMILGGRRMPADEALACGLVSEIVPRDQLLDRVLEWAGAIAEQNPVALRLAKQAIDYDAEHTAERIEALSQALLYELARRP
jgi:enoyl-CoA hydratase/carnithine racemase